MFNVGFLSSGVTRACLNAVGKMPVRRDVLIMCVSAGKKFAVKFLQPQLLFFFYIQCMVCHCMEANS